MTRSRLHARVRPVACLVVLITVFSSISVGGVVKIEAPLFEGGSGSEFFLRCAREYELQGRWEIHARDSANPAAGTAFEDRFTVRDGVLKSDVLSRQGFASVTIAPVRQEQQGFRWNLSAEASHQKLTGTVLADSQTLSGILSITSPAGAQTYKITGTKLNPILVDLYLDPRIADKVLVRILEGSFFELTNASINYWPLIHNDDVLPLEKYLDQLSWDGDTTWRDSFMPGTLDPYTDGKHVYGVPLPYSAYVIWYNKALFREHGWKTPVTWDDLFALCEKVKQAGIAPMAFQGRYPYYATYIYDDAYYHIAGPQAWRERGRLNPGSFDGPAGVRSFELLQKLSTNYFQSGALGMSHTEAQLQFFLGHAAMVPCGSWLKSEMIGKIPAGFELGCFNLPVVSDTRAEPTALNVRVESFVVMRKSRNPEAAVDFLRFLTSRRIASLFARMQDMPTAVRGCNEGNLSADLADLVKLIDGAKAGYGVGGGEGFPEIEQYYRDAMYEAISASDPPQTIAKRLQQHADAIRSRAQHPEHILIKHLWEPIALLAIIAGGFLWIIWRALLTRRRRRALDSDAPLVAMSSRNVALFIGPAAVLYTLFFIYPALRSFDWSMHRWNGLTPMSQMPFTGMLNFRRLLFESDVFWISLRNNLFLMLVIPLFVVPLSLFLAACISRNIWGSRTFRVIFFFPNLLGGVAATLLWLHVYNPQGGLVNSALVHVGQFLGHLGVASLAAWFDSFSGHAWLEPRNLYWSLIPISVWGACGFNMVLYLAAMETIPESYYEAARIDGAGAFRQFWTITIPLIWPILGISLVFLVIGGMKSFEIIWLLTNQQPPTQNHVVSTLLVQTMFQEFKVGEATAMAVMLFLMIFIATAATLRGMRRQSVEM